MRVWFNRTYATTCHLISQVRQNPDGRAVHVISTHVDPDSPVLAVSDHAELEPTIGPHEYVEWALQFALSQRVDVLVPRFAMAELAEARERFSRQGTVLACPEAPTIRLFEDKAAAYVAARQLDVRVPPHVVVSDGDGLRDAYARLSELSGPGGTGGTGGTGGKVCMKPVTGAGGEGYRRLTHLPATAAEYTGEVRSTVRVDAVAAAWERDGGPGVPMLVMPFLDGPEVSVDVLATPAGEVLAAVGRQHDESRSRRIVDDRLARSTAEILTAAHRIGYLSNTQVRYWRGPDDERQEPYLLEVNTRAAGGLFQTALAGVNLAWAALQVAAGEDPGSITPRFGATYVPIASIVALRAGG